MGAVGSGGEVAGPDKVRLKKFIISCSFMVPEGGG